MIEGDILNIDVDNWALAATWCELAVIKNEDFENLWA